MKGCLSKILTLHAGVLMLIHQINDSLRQVITSNKNFIMLKKITHFIFCLLYFLSASLVCFSQQLPPGLDNHIKNVMQSFEVPGVSIAIVKDGRVVLTKGYGVKEAGKNDPVDAHTLFCIASNTKAFTATALGMLVEEGKVKWGDPVINYLPWFRMSDPYVTTHMTIRDLLVHRSGLGLGASDLLQFPPSDYNRKEMTEKLRDVPLKTSFRNNFAYDNILYLVAGEVIHAASGMSWEEFIKKNILDKAGMTESTDRISQFDRQHDVAVSNISFEGKVIPNPGFPSNELTDASNPAGGIASNSVDMSKWLLTQLDSGKAPNGARLFLPETTEALWNLVTPISVSQLPSELKPEQMNFSGYGLGFFLQDYRGYKMVWHTGGLSGFVSKVTMIPALHLGICVLTNQESGAAFSAITNYILDYYMKAPSFDWLKSYREVLGKDKSNLNDYLSRQSAARDSSAGPSLPLGKYTGVYHDAWYGDIDISMEKDHLVMRFSHTPDLTGDMVHWQYDTFVVHWRDRELRADAFVTFSLDPDGSIYEARMKAFSPATDFSYDFQDLLLKPVVHN